MNNLEKDTALKSKKIELVNAVGYLAEAIETKLRTRQTIAESISASKTEIDLAHLANYKTQKSNEFNLFKNELNSILNDIDNVIKNITK